MLTLFATCKKCKRHLILPRQEAEKVKTSCACGEPLHALTLDAYRQKQPKKGKTKNGKKSVWEVEIKPAVNRREPISERFSLKVNKNTGYGPNGDCWPYEGYKNHEGYGKFNLDGTNVLAHRIAFCIEHDLLIEQIRGLLVMHDCDFPPCQRPSHLTLGGRPENNKDAREKGRHAHGEIQGVSKLTELKVQEIKRCAGKITNVSLAILTGVSDRMIGKIVNGEKWKHAPNIHEEQENRE